MKPHFSPDFFRQNREKLRTLFTGTAPIILTANGQLQRSGDTTFPFRQDSSFWYLTGIDDPDIILVLDKNKEYLIMPAREEWRDVFDGAIEEETLRQLSGIKDVYDEKGGWKVLSHRLKKVRTIATLSATAPYVDRYGFYANPARARLLMRIKEAAGEELELLDLRPHLARLRAVKQPVELEAIQYAIDTTVDVLKKVYKNRQKYAFEHEIEADITASFLKSGLGHAYPPIVASGKNAATVHHFVNRSPVDPTGLLLFDVGAEVSNYAADITRTYAVGEPTKRQQQIFDTVHEIYAFALSQLKPGVLIKEYEASVEHMMGEKLRELGLIKLIEKEEVRKFYPHLTSHFLGLDVHDVGDPDRPLEPGMVLTVEPGIYIAKESIGVRIEDDVLITSDGHQVLSAKLPITL